MANGVVDPGTALAMQGAIEQERGLARSWSAGANATVQAAYQQSAANKGALAADQIRQRYFKKEWEQIQDARINPLQTRLQSAKALREQTLMTTVMPVKGAALRPGLDPAMPNPNSQLGIPAAPAEGAGDVTIQPPDQTQIMDEEGGIERALGSDELSYIDPVSGEPVPISSPRGVAIMQQADSDFWGEYSAVNTEMMDVLGDYSGNPFADQMAERLIDLTIKQGNVATTGQTDPMKAQAYMDQRQEFEANMELKRQDVGAGKLALETQTAGLDVAARDAGRLASEDAAFRDLLGDKIFGKMQQGTALTRREKLEAASAVRTHRALQEKGILQRAKSGVYTIPAVIANEPSNWQGHMMTRDPVFQTYYGQEFATLANNTMGAIQNMDPVEMETTLRNAGAGDLEIARANEGLWNDPNLTAIVEKIANSSGAAVEANDRAMLRRLPELERQDPNMSGVIDSVLDQQIAQMRAAGYDPDEERMRAERYIPFFEATYGRVAPPTMDEFTTARVAHLLEGRRPPTPQAIEGLGTPFRAPEQPTGPLAPTPSDMPRSIFGPQAGTEQLPEEKAPATLAPSETKTVGEPSEWERVYGPGAKRPEEAIAAAARGVVGGVSSLARAGFGYEPSAPRERARGFAYDVEGRVLGRDGKPLEMSNPYANMELPVLKELIDSLPADSQAYELLAEAIASKGQ